MSEYMSMTVNACVHTSHVTGIRNPKPENDSNPTFEVALRMGTQNC